MYNVVIIGTGTMGREHMRSCRSLSNVKVVGVFDNRQSNAERYAEEFGVKAYSSFDEVLHDDAVQIILVCTPTSTHKEYVLRGLEASKHVFCEKPIARTLEDGEEIVAAAKRGKSKFMVGHVVRFFPEYLQLREIIRSGRIGRVGVARFVRAASFPHSVGEWYGDESKSGGVILDMMIHDVDYAQWLFGKVQRIYSKALTYDGHKEKDYALVVLRFNNGIIAHLEGSWMYSPPTFFTKFEVAGSEGIVEFDSRTSVAVRVTRGAMPSSEKSVEVPKSTMRKTPYALEIEHFIHCIDSNRKPLVGAEEALLALKISLAALESVKTQSVIHL
jgi:predicted dehydrogenase